LTVGLSVEVGPHWIVSSLANSGAPAPSMPVAGESSAWFAPWLERFADGTLQMGFSADPDNQRRAPINRSMMLTSEDLGESWWFDTLLAHGVILPFEARDGRRYLYGGTCSGDGRHAVREADAFITPRYLSYDRGRTWEGPEKVRLVVPDCELATFNGRPILELDDGRLMSAIYLCFAGQEKYRVVVVASEDGGKRWEYESTVAYDPDPDTPSFSEPALLQLASGDLLCMMRREGFHPMAQAVSHDAGSTWSEPVEVAGDGVWPDLCRMQSGVLVCAHGRPGCQLMVSLDGSGREWSLSTPIVETLLTPTILRRYWGYTDPRQTGTTGNRLFDRVFQRHFGDPADTDAIAAQDADEQGTWSKGYASVREIRPGELLYVYGLCRHPQGWRGGPLPTRAQLLESGLPTLNSIWATTVKVTAT
jgi:hypothetical protein